MWGQKQPMPFTYVYSMVFVMHVKCDSKNDHWSWHLNPESLTHLIHIHKPEVYE